MNKVGIDLEGKSNLSSFEREGEAGAAAFSKGFETKFRKATRSLYTLFTPREELIKARDALTPSSETLALAGQNPKLAKLSAKERIAISEAKEQVSAYKEVNKLIKEQDSYLTHIAVKNKEKEAALGTAAQKAAIEAQRQKEILSARTKEAEIQAQVKAVTQLRLAQELENERRITAEKKAQAQISQQAVKNAMAEQTARNRASERSEAQIQLRKALGEERIAEAEKLSQIRLAREAAVLELRAQDRAARAATSKIKEQSASIRGAARATHSLGKAMGRVTGIFDRFGRVLVARLYRMAAQKVIQLATEGIQALVQWDYEFGNNTSGALSTMTEIKSAVDQIKRSFGAMAMPIIQILMPVLRGVANIVITIANFINQIVRTVQGYSTYMKALYVEVSAVDDATQSAAGSARELERVLFGFDDLNILPDQNNRGGGGGIGGLGGQPLFEETEIENPFAEGIGGAIKKAMEALGPAISESLQGFKKVFSGVGKVIAGVVFGDFKLAWEGLTETWDGVKLIGKSIIDGSAIIKKNFDQHIATPLRIVFETSIETIKSLWQFATHPSNWNAEGIEELQRTVLSLWDDATEKIAVNLGWLKGNFHETFDAGKRENDEFTRHWGTAWVDTLEKSVGAIGEGKGSALAAIDELKNGSNTAASEVSSKWGETSRSISGNVQASKDIWITAFGIFTEEVKTKNDSANRWLESNPLVVRSKFENGKFQSEAATTIQNEQLKLDASPLSVRVNLLTNALGSALGSMLYQTQTALNNNPVSITTKIGETVNGILNPLNLISNVAGYISNIFNGSYASGGMVPNKGQLIQVNERGPEVVANMGSHTGIMNVNQMQEAVASGNIDVVNAVYAMANMIVNAVNSKDFDVYMDTAKVGQSVTNYQNNQMRRGVAY